jgi:hypothetical protein
MLLLDVMVVQQYDATFGRLPDPSGYDYWVSTTPYDLPLLQQRSSGARLVAGIDALGLARRLTSSSEFKRKAGALSNDAFVASLYETVLHRSPDPSGGRYWRSKLARGTSRASLIASFATSSEAIRKAGKEIEVIVSYETLLGRIPSATRTAALADRLEEGTPFTTIITEVLDSAAYEARVG